jgi:Animal haem peroxidase
MTTANRVHLRDHCLAPERVDAPFDPAGRYGRMFDLPALECDEGMLHRIGAAGGFCDGGDCEGDATIEAGWPFFGQYVAHDLTADRSPLRSHADLGSLRNMRAPRANLESLYGGGPGGSPYLFQRDDPAKLREDGAADGDVFDEARRSLTWHYQWLIVNEFLPSLAGSDLVAGLLADGPRFYRPDGAPFIPVEFADAAYRYGHSQIRQLYRLQHDGPLLPVFPDLIGFGPIAGRSIDWSLLFDVPGSEPAQRAKPIDGQLPRSLIELPQAITGATDDDAYRSLAARDLERGQGTGLPAGEDVAQVLGADVLGEEEIGLRTYGWVGKTPLWLYILRESSARHSGDRLGEVGGRICGEVLYGVIARDPESYVALDADWQPTLPARERQFRLRDLLVPA